jgi:hypothetical protein
MASDEDRLELSRAEAHRAAARAEQVRRRVEETARRVRHTTGTVRATYRATTAASTRFAKVKRLELAAHLSTAELHQQAARIQQQLGHLERAAEARRHADRARTLYRLAADELADYQARIVAARSTVARGRAVRAPGRPPPP